VGADIATADAFRKLAGAGYKYILVNLPASELLALSDLPEAKDTVLFNVGARDDRLRNADCRANVFHTLASRAMLTDALAQYLIKKKWNRWFLVAGKGAADKLYAADVKRSAMKFGAKIVEEKSWTYDAQDVRRSEQAEIPVFTQAADHHALIVADEADEFGDELMYRTWDPRPVAGTQGLIATDWHPAHDQWGATQLENRFRALAGRFMTATDFAAWAAVRAVGEAATRSQSADFAKIRDFLLGGELSLGVFKGVGANFRAWDHQLRQPILLAAPYTVVSVSPQPEFIHPVSNLDTLGDDKPESSCKIEGSR
jgi:ABC transporter substrate binding protein (PQQ-dependent alcohol dehydrogenase system)